MRAESDSVRCVSGQKTLTKVKLKGTKQNANEKQNISLLVFGIFTLMSGLFIINKSLSSNLPKEDYKINDEEE